MNLRATVLMLIAQVASLLSNYGIQVFLARELEPVGFGLFFVVFSMLMSVEFFVVAGIPNALQKFIAETPDNAYGIHRKFFKWQFFYAIAVVSIAFLMAPLIATSLEDQQVKNLFRIALLDVIPFGFFWYYAGFQIGLKRFEKFALISIIYSIFKFSFMSLFVMTGFETEGAFVGNACGSAVGTLTGIYFLKIQKTDNVQPLSPLVREFIIANIVYAIGLNLLYYIDIWFVKKFCLPEVVGHYSASATISKIPYIFSVALTGMILPSLSAAVAKQNRQEMHKIIHQGFRLALLAFLPCIAVIEIWAQPIMDFVFKSDYIAGAIYTRILFPGLTLLAIFSISNTMLMADRGMKSCGILVVALMGVSTALNAVLVPKFAAIGAAIATSTTLVIGLSISLLWLWRSYQTGIPMRTLLRIGFASSLMWVTGNFWLPQDTFSLFAGFGLLTAIYFIALFLTGELTKQDVRRAQSALMNRFV